MDICIWFYFKWSYYTVRVVSCGVALTYHVCCSAAAAIYDIPEYQHAHYPTHSAANVYAGVAKNSNKSWLDNGLDWKNKEDSLDALCGLYCVVIRSKIGIFVTCTESTRTYSCVTNRWSRRQLRGSFVMWPWSTGTTVRRLKGNEHLQYIVFHLSSTKITFHHFTIL